MQTLPVTPLSTTSNFNFTDKWVVKTSILVPVNTCPPTSNNNKDRCFIGLCLYSRRADVFSSVLWLEPRQVENATAHTVTWWQGTLTSTPADHGIRDVCRGKQKLKLIKFHVVNITTVINNNILFKFYYVIYGRLPIFSLWVIIFPRALRFFLGHCFKHCIIALFHLYFSTKLLKE